MRSIRNSPVNIQITGSVSPYETRGDQIGNEIVFYSGSIENKKTCKTNTYS